MKPTTRLLAAAALFAAVSLAATGCDTSPYAAEVNSHVIKQTALNAELRNWASNKQYVSAFDSANNSSGVNVVGDAPGTYSTEWVSSILNNMVTASLIRQKLGAAGQSPGTETVQAARAVSEISQIGWNSFAPAFRNQLVYRLADAALLTPTSVDQATLTRVYHQYKSYFFSRVCVLSATTFTLADAERLSSQGYPGGSQVCYDQAELENQPPALRDAIMALGLDKTSQPIKNAFGYQVVDVVSRDVIALTPPVQRTLSVAIVNAQGSPNPAVAGLLAHARVKVNPAFGSWSSGQVVAPKPPGSSA